MRTLEYRVDNDQWYYTQTDQFTLTNNERDFLAEFWTWSPKADEYKKGTWLLVNLKEKTYRVIGERK